jgi:hypothetical protein
MKREDTMVKIFFFLILAAGLFFLPAGAQAVGIGDKAPLFTVASDKGEVSLENYRGQSYVILAFYYAINTPA